MATQTARGATIYGIYPLNRYARLELSAGILQFGQEYNEPGCRRSPTSTSRSSTAGRSSPRARSCRSA